MSRRTEMVTIGDALQIIDRVRWVRKVATQISLDLEPAAGVWTYFDRLIIDPGVSHLSNDRYGAHVRLMGYAWKSDPPGSLPDDDRRLRAWCHDPPDWDAFKADLFGDAESAWRLHDGRWYQIGLCRAYLEQIVRRLRRMWSAAKKHSRDGTTVASRQRALQLFERCKTIHDSLESRAFQPLLFAPDERVPDPEPDAQQLSLFAEGPGGCVLDFPREGDVSGGCVPDVAEVDAGGCVPQFAVAVGGSGGCVPDAVGFDPDLGGCVLDRDQQQGALLEWPEVTDEGGCVPDPSLGSIDFDPDLAPAWADLEARDLGGCVPDPPSVTGGCVPDVEVDEIPPKSLPGSELCNAPAMHALSMSRSMSSDTRSSKLAGAHARDGPREAFAAQIFQIFRDLTGQRRLPLPGEVELAGEWFDRGLSVGQIELLFRQRLASTEVTWMTYFRRVEALDEYSPELPRSDIESDRRTMLKALDGLELDAGQLERLDAARIHERAMAARTALDLERIEQDLEEALDG